jgi:hypothetical protein
MTTYWLSDTIGNAERIIDGDMAVATSDPAADFAFEWLSTHAPNRRQAVLFLKKCILYIENGGIGTAGGQGTDIPLPP